ncbi:MAG: hypothetical protein IPJ81_05915 [Chitinophagaceae bacterium]|nr:hypothetical protein [Chitinophagaceae bacterium]
MVQPADKITDQDDIHSILIKLDVCEENHLPVVYDGKYIGFISKALLLTKYRDEILKTS